MYAGAAVSTVELIILLAVIVDIKAYHAMLGHRLHRVRAELACGRDGRSAIPAGPCCWYRAAHPGGGGGKTRDRSAACRRYVQPNSSSVQPWPARISRSEIACGCAVSGPRAAVARGTHRWSGTCNTTQIF
jgi:hypothetical protein